MEKVRRVRREQIMEFVTCSICNNPFKNATSINECLHTFCKKCIEDMVEEEGMTMCPVCNTDLGSNPLQKLRVDHHIQQITNSILASARRSKSVTSAPKTKPQQLESGPANAEVDEERVTIHPQESKSSLQGRKKKICGSSAEEPITISDDSSDNAEQNKQLTIREADPSGRKGKKPIMEKMKKLAIVEKFEPMITRSKGKKLVNERMGKKGIWFRLFASDVQEGHPPLPQLSVGYLNVKKPDLSVLDIQKYIACKLGLKSRHEVEISLVGIPLPSDFIFQDLMDETLEEAANKVKFNITMGGSASDFAICLYYARKAHPRKP